MKNISLFKILATIYHIYIKSQNYHWNVKGKDFLTIHAFMEKLYSNKKDLIDELAERISQLGDVLDASFSNYLKHSETTEPKTITSSEEILKDLSVSYGALISLVLKTTQEYKNDISTSDLLTKLAVLAEKEKWLIDSQI